MSYSLIFPRAKQGKTIHDESVATFIAGTTLIEHT